MPLRHWRMAPKISNLECARPKFVILPVFLRFDVELNVVTGCKNVASPMSFTNVAYYYSHYLDGFVAQSPAVKNFTLEGKRLKLSEIKET